MSVVLSPLTNFYLYEGLVRGGWNLSLLWLHPLAVVAGAGFVFDSPDYAFFLLTGKDRDFYDRADKVLDACFYLAAAIYYTYFWRRLWYAKYIAPLLYYRIVGNIVFLITLGSWVPLVFPNLGEALMWVYSALDYGFPGPHPGRRFDRFFERHRGWNWALIGVTVAVKWGLEAALWADGNSVVDPPLCVSVHACWGLYGIPLLFFAVFAVLASYWRTAHFVEGSVRRSRAGVPVKVFYTPLPTAPVTRTLADFKDA